MEIIMTSIKKQLTTSVCAVMLTLGVVAMPMASLAGTVDTVMVGGAEMFPTKDIIDNAVNSKDHTTLVTAVKAAGLVETLKSKGPFTVFAPTNDGFAKLPQGTVETLLKPENKAKLAGILTYHVVAGKLTAADIEAMAKANGGKASLKTVQGQNLTVSKNNAGTFQVSDESGNIANITIANVMQSNGVIHVIDTVVLPK